MKYYDVLCGFMFIITDTNPYSNGARIAFLLDVSMRVSEVDFYLQRFTAAEVALELSMELTKFDAAVVKYSDEPTLVLKFSPIDDFYTFLYGPVYWPGKSAGRQRIDKALTFTSKYVFSSAGQEIPKIAILFAFTEHLQPGHPLGKASESLRQKGVRILVVEVNSINPRKELLNITERENDLIHIRSLYEVTYNDVIYLVTKVLRAIGKY